MNRTGSGTSWLPDSAPLFIYMKQKGDWHLMTGYNIFLRYNNQDFLKRGARGASKFDLPGMGMLMAQRKISRRGNFSSSLMVSSDILSIGGEGYPLLFQTGETWKGEPLVDRQHPHDLLMELSAGYSHKLGSKADWFAYGGYPAEPALGPPNFMHRPSSFNNPSAPLAHHWQDATHITYGVVTSGFRLGIFQLEGSMFNGNEPDENRIVPDKPVLNSYSYRIQMNRSGRSVMQFSQGWITEHHEIGHHDTAVLRTSFSVLRTSILEPGSFLHSAFIIGVNKSGGQHSGSVLFETTYQHMNSALFSRVEVVEKSYEALNIPDQKGEVYLGHFSLGYNRKIVSLYGVDLSAGLVGTVSAIEPAGEPVYGKYPVSGQVFLRFFPKQYSHYEKPKQEPKGGHIHHFHANR